LFKLLLGQKFKEMRFIMKEILQQVKEELEKTFSHPESHNLDHCIKQLQAAKEQYGDKGTMLEDCIRSVEQAKNAQIQLEKAGDVSSSAAFGEAFNALEQAIESYTDPENDPI
jgi:polyribonucleotide nucleotidyltransferase